MTGKPIWVECKILQLSPVRKEFQMSWSTRLLIQTFGFKIELHHFIVFVRQHFQEKRRISRFLFHHNFQQKLNRNISRNSTNSQGFAVKQAVVFFVLAISINNLEKKAQLISLKMNFFCEVLSKVMVIVPIFGTKVTEYLCSGWVFFSSDKLRLFN